MKQYVDSAKSLAALVAFATPLVLYCLAHITSPNCGLSLRYSVPYGHGSIPLRFYDIENPGPANLQDVTLSFTIDHPYDVDTSLPQRPIKNSATSDTRADSAEQADVVQVAYMNVDVFGPNTIADVEGLSDNMNCRYRISPNKRNALGAGDSFSVVITGQVPVSDMCLSYSQRFGRTKTVEFRENTPMVHSVSPSWLSLNNFLLLLSGIVLGIIAAISYRPRPKTSLRSIEMPPDVTPEQSLWAVEKATPEEAVKATLTAIFEDFFGR